MLFAPSAGKGEMANRSRHSPRNHDIDHRNNRAPKTPRRASGKDLSVWGEIKYPGVMRGVICAAELAEAPEQNSLAFFWRTAVAFEEASGTTGDHRAKDYFQRSRRDHPRRLTDADGCRCRTSSPLNEGGPRAAQCRRPCGWGFPGATERGVLAGSRALVRRSISSALLKPTDR